MDSEDSLNPQREQEQELLSCSPYSWKSLRESFRVEGRLSCAFCLSFRGICRKSHRAPFYRQLASHIPNRRAKDLAWVARGLTDRELKLLQEESPGFSWRATRALQLMELAELCREFLRARTPPPDHTSLHDKWTRRQLAMEAVAVAAAEEEARALPVGSSGSRSSQSSRRSRPNWRRRRGKRAQTRGERHDGRRPPPPRLPSRGAGQPLH